MKTELSRRTFLGGMTAAGAAPLLFSGCATGFLANSRARIGVIGLGRIATSFEIPCVLARPELARIVAVCDLDSKRVDNAKQMIEKKYADGTVIDTYHDYKELCARKDIDAVMICVPDFWHALVATTAICSGKHIWLQKPFTQTIKEGRLLANLAKKYGCVMQVGSQQRSWSQFRGVCEAVQAGVLGSIKKVEVGIGLDVAGGSSAAQPVPANFDYATWLGPTDPNAPYNETRCHTQNIAKIQDRPGWIQLAPYGWGMITNWGAHHLDITQWGLGKELSGPESVEGTCQWMDLSGGKLWNVHTNYDLHYSYNGGKTDVHVCDRYQNGVKFIGENGEWLFCTRGAVKVTASDPEPKVKAGELKPLDGSSEKVLKLVKMTPMKSGKATQEHIDNWLAAILAEDRRLTVTSAEVAHRSTSVCSLGQMCMRLGRKVSWNSAKETTGDREADALMKPFARDRFDLRVNLKEFGLDFDEVMKG